MDELTNHELRILRAYAEYGNQQLAADMLGIKLQTVKNAMGEVYSKLDVTNSIGAFKAMGWLQVPRW